MNAESVGRRQRFCLAAYSQSTNQSCLRRLWLRQSKWSTRVRTHCPTCKLCGFHTNVSLSSFLYQVANWTAEKVLHLFIWHWLAFTVANSAESALHPHCYALQVTVWSSVRHGQTCWDRTQPLTPAVARLPGNAYRGGFLAGFARDDCSSHHSVSP